MIPLKFLCPKWQADKWLKHEAISLFFDFTKVFKWSHFWFGICFSVIFQTSAKDQSVWEVVQSCSVKKEFLHLSLNPQVFSCDFCETFRNTSFYRRPLVPAPIVFLVRSACLPMLALVKILTFFNECSTSIPRENIRRGL